MGFSQTAYRYANALLMLAREKRLEEIIGDDLGRLDSVVISNGLWVQMITAGKIPFKKRMEMVEEVLTSLELQEATGNFVKVLVEKGRLPLFPEILTAYRQELLRVRGEVEAHVTVARKATWDSLQEEIIETIKDFTGSGAEIKVDVDENLMGGLTIRVGDKLYDGSVRGELHRLRETMINQAGEI